MADSFAVLTYHSQAVGGERSPVNDHLALAEDLEVLTRSGYEVVPVRHLLDWLDARPGIVCPRRAVCLTFDDGCDLDVEDIDFPGAGPQRSFLGILHDHIEATNGAQRHLHATSFVIACPRARHAIDQRSLFGQGWMSDGWWRSAGASGLLAIGNHGWDHNHPDVEPGEPRRGEFEAIDTEEACRRQVVQAAQFIAERSGSWPEIYAYPYGESSAYMRECFMPRFRHEHRCRAAFGGHPGRIDRESDRWNLPRFVCGRDWESPSELLRVLEDQ